MLGGSDQRLRVRLRRARRVAELAGAARGQRGAERPGRRAGPRATRSGVAERRPLRAVLGDVVAGEIRTTGRRSCTRRGGSSRLDDGERLSDAALMDWSALVERGREGARVELATLGRWIRDLRQPAHLWVEQTNEALIALMAGDYAEAAVWIARGSKTGTRSFRRATTWWPPAAIRSCSVGRLVGSPTRRRRSGARSMTTPGTRSCGRCSRCSSSISAVMPRPAPSSTGSPGTTSQPSTPTASGCSGWHWPARRATIGDKGSGSRPLRTTRALRRPTRRGARRRKRRSDRPTAGIACSHARAVGRIGRSPRGRRAAEQRHGGPPVGSSYAARPGRGAPTPRWPGRPRPRR